MQEGHITQYLETLDVHQNLGKRRHNCDHMELELLSGHDDNCLVRNSLNPVNQNSGNGNGKSSALELQKCYKEDSRMKGCRNTQCLPD